MEAQDQNFAMEGIEGEERFGDELSAFEGGEMIEGGFLVAGNFEGALFVAGLAEFFEAGHGAAAAQIDDEVAGDGEEPGIEAGIAVELGAAHEHTHPGFLKKVFGDFAIAGEVKEVAEEAVLIFENQLVEDMRVMTLEAFGYAGILGAHLAGELERCCLHITFSDGQRAAEDAGGCEFLEFFDHIQPARSCWPGFSRGLRLLLVTSSLSVVFAASGKDKLDGMEVIYGLHPVVEGLRSGGRRFDHVCVGRERLSHGDAHRLDEILALCRAAGVPVRKEPREALTRLAGSPGHQGVVAVVRERDFLGVEDLLEGKEPRLVLALDGVEDPQNLGALLRTAEGAGVDGVLLTERRSAPLSAVAMKASAGAAEHLRLARVVNLVRALEALKERNLWCVGLDERGTTDYDGYDFKSNTVIVLGREGAGLHDLVRRTCDHLLRIPMAGRVNSLNVAAAGAVVLFEAARQRRAASSVGGATQSKPQKGLGS